MKYIQQYLVYFCRLSVKFKKYKYPVFIMSSTIRKINGLVALVTGGASGLGEGTVRRLMLHGACVVICDLPSSKGIELANELGDKCAFVSADVTNEVEVEQAIKFVERKYQKLDVLVNCAGIASKNPTYDFDKEVPHPLVSFERVVSINTTGTFNVTRLAVGLMGRNEPGGPDGQRGVIVNTSSVSSLDSSKGIVAYAASKGAVNSMTLPMALDLASQGIRCCTIAPGVFETPILNKEGQKSEHSIVAQIPFPKRYGIPDEFAHLVQTIVENPMLNGCVIRLDGALRMKLP